MFFLLLVRRLLIFKGGLKIDMDESKLIMKPEGMSTKLFLILHKLLLESEYKGTASREPVWRLTPKGLESIKGGRKK